MISDSKGVKNNKKKKKRFDLTDRNSDSEMGDIEKPNFYQNITEDELKRIRN